MPWHRVRLLAMENLVELLFTLLGAVVLSGFIIWFVTRSTGAAARSRDGARIDALEDQIAERTTERDAARRRIEELHIENSELRSRAAGDAERLKWLENAEKRLSNAFEALSARTLQVSTKSLQELSREQLAQFANVLRSDWGTQKEQIKGVVEPLAMELKKLDNQVRQMEEKREGAYRTIGEQIRSIGEQTARLQSATTSLGSALRDSGVRGKWGEIQLRRLVEMAGLANHVDFEEQQVTFGDRGTARPDMIIRLPSRGIVPVDAKAPMNAYLEAQDAASPELTAAAMKRHAAAMRKHVQVLAQKAYWEQFDRAAEFVVMLVPYESGLVAAFDADPDLLEYALANRVVVSSPTSFLALLRVIAYGWLQLELSRNAARIATTGKELLERLGPFSDHLNKLGSALNQATEKFNDVAGSFERRVLPTARKLQELGASSEPPAEISHVDSRTRHIEPPE